MKLSVNLGGLVAMRPKPAPTSKIFAVARSPQKIVSGRKIERMAVTIDEYSSLMTIADEATEVEFDELTEEDAREIYHDMKLGREFEEMCA